MLERPVANPEKGQWTLLIGENGVGKTSFLQALAFAAGKVDQILSLARWLGANTIEDSAIVELSLADGFQIERKTGRKFGNGVLGNADPKWEVWAYGSQRGNSLGGPDRTVELQESSIDSLFDSKWRLIHAETWLKNLQLAALQENGRAARFLDAVKAVLKQILPDVEAVEVRSNDVFLNRKGEGQVPLQAWSDGYLTTAGWILDMIARWAARAWKNGAELDTDFAEKMTGLVLIDEIDLHLHPAWQTQVVRDLRRLFPKLSFVATTHNPLTLLGAEPGEIFVVRRNAEGKIEAKQRDIPPGLNVEQVLTGDWFGLSSTLDKGTLELLDRHRAMLRNRISPQDPVRQELEMTLRRRLGTFGDTSIDRMVQSVAAELMPRAAEDLDAEERTHLRAKILAVAKKKLA